jgi:hypothetical protein
MTNEPSLGVKEDLEMHGFARPEVEPLDQIRATEVRLRQVKDIRLDQTRPEVRMLCVLVMMFLTSGLNEASLKVQGFVRTAREKIGIHEEGVRTPDL